MDGRRNEKEWVGLIRLGASGGGEVGCECEKKRERVRWRMLKRVVAGGKRNKKE